MYLHPDDLLNFHEVVAAMETVAKKYSLPLRSVSPMPNPDYATSPLGSCSGDGNIYLTMRGKHQGAWDITPRHLDDVWSTAGHELAHLKFMNHGKQFSELESELIQAMKNRQVDHTQKVIEKIIKMQNSRASEMALGNEAAAEAFAGMINKMLIEHELNPSDIDYARATDKDPVIEMRVTMSRYHFTEDNGKVWRFEAKKVRIAWQETLARIVANAHLCSFLVNLHNNDITFVGTKSHAMVAEYVYGTMVPLTEYMSRVAAYVHKLDCKKTGRKDYHGYRESWLEAFIQRIGERFAEARKSAVAEAAADLPGGQTTALVRLSGALQKTQKYIDDKFQSKKRYAHSLRGPQGRNEAGATAGRAAANDIPIGRRAVDTVTKKQIGG